MCVYDNNNNNNLVASQPLPGGCVRCVGFGPQWGLLIKKKKKMNRTKRS